jgi:hypothetical protein
VASAAFFIEVEVTAMSPHDADRDDELYETEAALVAETPPVFCLW